MQLARRKAPERLDLTPLQLLNQHNTRTEKERKLEQSSKEVAHLALIGAPFWSHFTRGDPFAEFQRDKGLRQSPGAAEQCIRRPIAEEKATAVPRELLGSFRHLEHRVAPAQLAWRQNGPHSRVPLPQMDAIIQVTGTMRRPRSEGLISVTLGPSEGPGQGKFHHTTSSVCLGTCSNTFERRRF
ncbi:unnamed protein product [Effrenium voratum]|nr:unnamed protein product [Effrenium voratum]